MTSILLLVGGLVVLVLGAECLVRGAGSLARAWGLSPLVVGLTVIAWGTSAPEVAVSVRAAYAGQGGIALGNVIGSNLFNIVAVLGLAAVIAPLTVQAPLIRRDLPVLIALSAGTWLLAADGLLALWEGLVFLCSLLIYTAVLLRSARSETTAAQAAVAGGPVQERPRGSRLLLAGLGVLVGLGLLVLGADWLVAGAVRLAAGLGVSDLVIGLTIVAGGTSLPELAASAVAAWRGQRDLAIGNVVGSNIFNLLGVLGAGAVVAGDGISVDTASRAFTLPLMVGTALLCWPLCRSGVRISRLEGAYLLLGYVLITSTVVLQATGISAAGLLAIATWIWLAVGLLGSAVLLWRGTGSSGEQA